jgi:hypothetical protein
MKRTVLLTMILCALSLLWSSCQTAEQGRASSSPDTAGVPSMQAPAVSVDRLRAILDKPDVVIIDLRIETDWQRSDHKIPGAIRKDPNTVDSWADSVDKDSRVVTYCA